MKILVIGPSSTKSKGGMATVIAEIQEDKKLNEQFDIDIYESYVDGNKLKVLFVSVFKFIKFYFTKRNYDLYHIHAASFGSTFRKGLYLKTIKRWNKKVIFHIHGASYMEFYAGLSEKNKQKVIEILHLADLVVALSEDWKNKFDSTFGLDNCVVLENGINMRAFRSAISNECNEKKFLMLGRLGERKGTYDLLDAVEIVREIVPDIKLYLAGDGEIEEVKKIINKKRLEKNVFVLGWINFEQKKALLKKVGTIVLPSYNEGLPMAILEGMACGKAIISTNVGAIPEVISEDNGILIIPGDVRMLAEAMKKIALNPGVIKRMADANIEKIRSKFSSERMHDRMSNLYLQLGNGYAKETG